MVSSEPNYNVPTTLLLPASNVAYVTLHPGAAQVASEVDSEFKYSAPATKARLPSSDVVVSLQTPARVASKPTRARVATSKVGFALQPGSIRIPSPAGSAFRLTSPVRTRLGSPALAAKFRDMVDSASELATPDKKTGLLEKISTLSTREQTQTALRKIGDQEEHSVLQAKSLDEKHSTAIADGFGGQSQNVSSLSTTQEKLSSSQIVAGVGKHAVSTKETDDEKHTASSVGADGEETHLSSASAGTDEKHSVFASGNEGDIPLQARADAGGDGRDAGAF